HKWLKGESFELIVVLRDEPHALNALPSDLLQHGRKLSFSLATLFPKLSCPVTAALENEDLETLFKAQQFHNPGKLGENGTKEFILRHIFEIAPELIKEPKDLLRVLLRLHYSGRRIPHIINRRFIHILRQNHRFDTWPLETIIPNREDFFAFLQERWSLYLDRLTTPEADPPKAPGPLLLPFEHDDIRIYIDNLFNEGYLKPISHEQTDLLNTTWARIGVRINPDIENKRRLDGLLQSIQTSLPRPQTPHNQWLQFAYRWAELNALVYRFPNLPQKHQKTILADLRAKIDTTFSAWIHNRFAGLVSLPPLPPVMLHH
ncbi:MAG: BREX-3 system phosphatase PglZ, partial [bacterium]|nr:BREX-3 system phosphatase PglZ [bacterium]